MRDLIRRLFPTAWVPRSGAHDGYQYDLDGSLRYDRFATGVDFFPWVGGDGTVAQIGAVSGLLPMADTYVWGQMIGKEPFGPGSTTFPLNLQYQITIPGLYKMG